MIRRSTEQTLPVGHTSTREPSTIRLNTVEQAHYDAVLDNPFFTAFEKIHALRRICLHSETKFEHVHDAILNALTRPKHASSEEPVKIVLAEAGFAQGITRDIHDDRPEESPGEETYLFSRLRNTFPEITLFVLDGKNSDQREVITNQFNECRTPAILVTLLSVAGEGISLVSASEAILISPASTAARESQFLRRLLRRGQTKDVNLQILLMEHSIEQGILEYAEKKDRVVRGLIDGRPLNALEREILRSDFSRVREGGVVAYETFSPRQKVLWILSRLQGKGKDAIRDFLYADGGKYANDFARGYTVDEATSYSGNTARLVGASIDSLQGGSPDSIDIADIACGCRTLERMYEGSRTVRVASTDINEAALHVGGELLKAPRDTSAVEVACMDELPYGDASKDIAVISLALHYTRHTRRDESAGEERIRALKELNRVLKPSGHAIITLPEKFFPDEDSFECFAGAISTSFGFIVEQRLTGIASADMDDGGDPYRSWILTLRKVADAAPVPTNELWRNLRFPRLQQNEAKGIRKPQQISQENGRTGTYHDAFTIGDQRLRFQEATVHQLEIKADRQLDVTQEKRLRERVETLITTYGDIKSIPEHLLLSISPDQVSQSVQEDRDLYFETLIKRYRSVEKIPVERISNRSSVIIIRGASSKGSYLCLARLQDRSGPQQQAGGFGRRYFYDNRD